MVGDPYPMQEKKVSCLRLSNTQAGQAMIRYRYVLRICDSQPLRD